MIAQMKQLAMTTSALDAIRQDLIRCGFELEFHAVNGVSEDEDSGCGDEDSDRRVPADEISAPHIEVGSDSSVRGGEVRTLGALKPQEFMAAAIALFKDHDFEIDTGCSFHIHLSVPGIKHTYGKRLQAEMMAFLLANQDRLPESVRTRLKSNAIRYCHFKLSPDKFTAVHGHPQKTWEFRLFGNVTTAMEAWRCLLLAIDAMRHAYRVRCELTNSLVSVDEILDFDNLAASAIQNSRSLVKQARYNKLFKRQAQPA